MKQVLFNALNTLGISRAALDSLVEIPKDSSLGDYAIPCFSFAKEFKKNPVEIAKEFAAKLQGKSEFEKVEAIGPYVNFFMSRELFATHVLKIIESGKKVKSAGKKKTAMIEFSQPNTHKAFHVGHIRGTSFGESLARIFEYQGTKVIRANYSGDTGMHIAKWLWAYTQFHSKEKPKKEETWFAELYVEAVKKLEDNEKGQQEVDEINRKLDSRKDPTLNRIWKETRKLSIAAWKPIYKDLDTHFDAHFFESEVEIAGKELAQELVKKGIAIVSEEAVIVDLKEFGLSVWVLLRKDGTALYSAKDLALAQKKFDEFKLDRSIVITSTEQNLHFQQLIKTLHLMNVPYKERYGHTSYGTIRLPTGKMSSRTGQNVLYSAFKQELVDYASEEIKKRFPELKANVIEKRALAIAIAAMKYSMLKQESHKDIIFNKEEILRFEGDTGPYLLYTYARAQSILRKSGKHTGKQAKSSINEEEKRLLIELGRFNETVQQAYDSLSPHILGVYAYRIAQLFNEFYHAHQVLGSAEEQARLRIIKAFTQVFQKTMHLLAIPLLEEM